ncbi:MAG: hypothetical protein R3D88_07620 [Alphaproteobacteria bacterium]|nr:hypothetical protein [Alphaproteobacteria bacterium]
MAISVRPIVSLVGVFRERNRDLAKRIKELSAREAGQETATVFDMRDLRLSAAIGARQIHLGHFTRSLADPKGMGDFIYAATGRTVEAAEVRKIIEETGCFISASALAPGEQEGVLIFEEAPVYTPLESFSKNLVAPKAA